MKPLRTSPLLLALVLALALPVPALATHSPAAATASPAASATTTAITSLTLTPPSLASGKVYLKAAGQNIDSYLVSVDCPALVFLKSGSRNFCGTTRRLTAKKMRKLWLNLKNQNQVAGYIELVVQGVRKGEREPVVERVISLVVKAE